MHAMHADQSLMYCFMSTGLTIDAQVHLSALIVLCTALLLLCPSGICCLCRDIGLSCKLIVSLMHLAHQRRPSLQWRYANGTKTCLSRWVAQVHMSANSNPGHSQECTTWP